MNYYKIIKGVMTPTATGRITMEELEIARVTALGSFALRKGAAGKITCGDNVLLMGMARYNSTIWGLVTTTQERDRVSEIAGNVGVRVASLSGNLPHSNLLVTTINLYKPRKNNPFE